MTAGRKMATMTVMTFSEYGADDALWMVRLLAASTLDTTTSWRVTTPGWLSRAAALASRSARSRNVTRSAPVGPTGSSTSFTATARPSRTSSARHTVPIPPRPSGPPRT